MFHLLELLYERTHLGDRAIGGGQQELVNNASIYVKLVPIEDRKVSQQDLMVKARSEVLPKFLKQYPNQLRTSVQQVAAISGGGFRNADIQYVIGGPDQLGPMIARA